MYDFTNGISEFRNNVAQLSPNWQEVRIPWSTDIKLEGIAIVIYGSTPLDSMELFMSLEFNDIVFHYENGDTVLVDPFQYTNPNGIIEQLPGIPTGFILHQNYPNPFNPTTRIRYKISEPSDVKLSVYSLLGEKITDVVDEYQYAGIYEAEFDASGLASGTYIYVLQAGNQPMRRKFVYLK